MQDEVMQEKINEWKSLYTYVYKIVVAGNEYYFHSLDRNDYVDILSIQASMKDPRTFDHDLEVCKKCILSEYDESELTKKAGISVVIAEKIMLLSGFEQAEIEQL